MLCIGVLTTHELLTEHAGCSCQISAHKRRDVPLLHTGTGGSRLTEAPPSRET